LGRLRFASQDELGDFVRVDEFAFGKIVLCNVSFINEFHGPPIHKAQGLDAFLWVDRPLVWSRTFPEEKPEPSHDVNMFRHARILETEFRDDLPSVVVSIRDHGNTAVSQVKRLFDQPGRFSRSRASENDLIVT
jgi:hypothetical protein